MRQGSFDDNAEAYAADERRVPRRPVPARGRRPATSACGARSTGSRSCRTTRRASRSTATRPTTSRSPGSSSGCGPSAAATRPGCRPSSSASPAGSTPPTRSSSRPRRATASASRAPHVLGFTMPGFATSAGTKSNAIHLMESLGITWEELDIRPAATQMLTDLGHPFGRGEEVYDVTFENVQAGLRTDYLFRAANQRGGIVLGTGDLSELALGWCTYGVGDQMSHYGVNAGVPKTLMQHLIRWVVSSAQFEGRSTTTLARDPRPGDQPRARAHQGGRADPVDRGLRRPLRPAGLHALPRAATRLPAQQDRLPRRARLGATPTAARGRRATPRARARPTTSRPSGAGWRSSSSASSPTSSSARPSPTGPRSSPGGRCRRAVTGGCRPTPASRAWLAELEANVPKA